MTRQRRQCPTGKGAHRHRGPRPGKTLARRVAVPRGSLSSDRAAVPAFLARLSPYPLSVDARKQHLLYPCHGACEKSVAARADFLMAEGWSTTSATKASVSCSPRRASGVCLRVVHSSIMMQNRDQRMASSSASVRVVIVGVGLGPSEHL